MSVLACDRKDCHNIMCDRLILNNSAYICDSCWNELLEYKKTWPKLRKKDIKIYIVNFMNTVPGSFCNKYLNQLELEEEFKNLTNSA